METSCTGTRILKKINERNSYFVKTRNSLTRTRFSLARTRFFTKNKLICPFNKGNERRIIILASHIFMTTYAQLEIIVGSSNENIL